MQYSAMAVVHMFECSVLQNMALPSPATWHDQLLCCTPGPSLPARTAAGYATKSAA